MGIKVDQLIQFLGQFNPESEVAFYIQGEPRMGSNIRLYRERNNPGFHDWPVIMFECTERCDQCGLNVPADDVAIVSRSHHRSCPRNPNYRRQPSE